MLCLFGLKQYIFYLEKQSLIGVLKNIDLIVNGNTKNSDILKTALFQENLRHGGQSMS